VLLEDVIDGAVSQSECGLVCSWTDSFITGKRRRHGCRPGQPFLDSLAVMTDFDRSNDGKLCLGSRGLVSSRRYRPYQRDTCDLLLDALLGQLQNQKRRNLQQTWRSRQDTFKVLISAIQSLADYM